MCPMRKVNIYQYKEALINAGHEIVEDLSQADKVLVWTCAVREDLHDHSIAVLDKYEKMGKKVIAAGCLPSINPEYIDNEFKGDVIHFRSDREEFKKIFDVDIEAARYPIIEAPIPEPIEIYRAKYPDMKIVWDDQYIKLFIAEGCTRRCSYCTEILAFGPFQSYPKEYIVLKAKEMIKKTGVHELALFGDDIGAYGSDINSNLPELINELVAIHPDVRISLKQINPYYMKKLLPSLIPLMDKGKIFQILIPIQSANSRILKLMDREYDTEDLNNMFDILNKTGVELETHVITGFPTESEEEWEETVDFICKYKFRYVMGNLYMPGRNTKAANMAGQIPPLEKEQRMLSGAKKMESNGIVIGHSLNFRGKEHITHQKIDLIEF